LGQLSPVLCGANFFVFWSLSAGSFGKRQDKQSTNSLIQMTAKNSGLATNAGTALLLTQMHPLSLQAGTREYSYEAVLVVGVVPLH
jgi:hypothetical protein